MYRRECRVETGVSSASDGFFAIQTKRIVYLAAFIWVAMTLACMAKAYFKPTKNTVFPIYTFAAGEWLAGRDLYVKMPEYDYYRYSPLMAAFFVPWRMLDDAWSGMLWRLLGMVVLTCGLFRWLRDVMKRDRPTDSAVLFLLVAPFVLQNLHNGQSNVHMLGLLLLGAADAAGGRPWRSALWFAMAGFIKPYVLAMAGLVAIVETRLFIRLTIMLLAGVAITFLFQRPGYVAEQYHDWFFHFFENDRSNSAMRDWYRDLQLLFRVYLWPLPPRVYYFGSAVVGLAMAFVVHRLRTSMNKSNVICLACALGGCWVTVLGPATESCTYLLLAPMLATALLVYSGTGHRVLILSYCLFFLTIAAALFPANWKVQVWGPQPIAGLLFLTVITCEIPFRRTIRKGVRSQYRLTPSTGQEWRQFIH